MAESRGYVPIQHLDLVQILQEAQHRWLRPTEICEILRNHKKFQLTPDPPIQPPAGSLFLFDRKALRYFRKDGHRWRKKKDGKTVKEAHEKLKAGSVDVLHCYYAHGEDNENFQRRSYWMLDRQLEHIVLVHYREVKEGYKSSISRLLPDLGEQVANHQSGSPISAQANLSIPTVQTSCSPSPDEADWNGQTFPSKFEDGDSCGGRNSVASSIAQSLFGSAVDNTSLLGHGVSGFPEISRDKSGSWCGRPKFSHGVEPPRWAEIHNLERSRADTLHEHKLFAVQPSEADIVALKLTDARLNGDGIVHGILTCDNSLINDADIPALPQRVIQVPQEHAFTSVYPMVHDGSNSQTVLDSNAQNVKESKDSINNDAAGELKKLDSFGRWLDKEIGRDCDGSLMASDSGNYWSTLDAETDEKEVSSFSHHMQLDIDSLGPSLSQDQLFTICDFSPDWAYSGVETKVLIIGCFLGSKKLSTDTKWGCMFGEIEVSAEVLTENVLRCQTPLHAPGHVPFYVTCSNRLACSEVREFEYREKPEGILSSAAVKIAVDDKIHFQMRLTRLLNLGPEKKWLECSIEECEQCKIKNTISSLRSGIEKHWKTVEGTCLGCRDDHVMHNEVLIQNLLKDRLFEWLVCKVHKEGGRGPHVLDEEGQGVIHLAAALGYEWAMVPIVHSGVHPNFRDSHGRTALHWASYCGREEMVIALIRLGAAPGAVDDPTPTFPGGQTAADLASSRGHKGIAGYLAEADLTTHFSILTVNEYLTDYDPTALPTEEAIPYSDQATPSHFAADDDIPLKGSLAAVRKSTHVAALIHAAFRAHSFCHRELTKSNNDIPQVSLDLVALGHVNKVRKINNYEDYLHVAAIRIQQKYRGWKGRKDFLKIRNRIVKIQAHVRGHQVRKLYKKVVWSVGIVEKAILRWRRKGNGLRGFRVKKVIETLSLDEYDFLQIGRKLKYANVEKALARVKSMARHPEAREQYMRLVSKFKNSNVNSDEEGNASQQMENALHK